MSLPHHVNVIVKNARKGDIFCWISNETGGGRPYPYAWATGAKGSPHQLAPGESLPVGQDAGQEAGWWYVNLGPKDGQPVVKITKMEVDIGGRPDLPSGPKLVVRTNENITKIHPYQGPTTLIIEVFEDWGVSIRYSDYREYVGYPVVFQIKVSDADFHEIKNGEAFRCTDATMEAIILPGNKDRVQIVPAEPGQKMPKRIKTAHKLDFEFHILREGYGVETAEARDHYRPLGFVLKRTQGDDPTGWVNFGAFRLRKNVLTIRNFNPHNDTDIFQYYILIQNKDGLIGIIDPEIENDPA